LDAGQIAVSYAEVHYEGAVIGSFTGGTGTNPLVVTFNANATTSAVQALLRRVTYENVSDNPVSERTVRLVLTDGDGGSTWSRKEFKSHRLTTPHS
jgi:hypothetical protein